MEEERHPRPFEDHVYRPVQNYSPDQADDEPQRDSSSMADQRQVSQYLTRVQVVTPLSILLNLAALTVCSIIIKPGLGDVNKQHVTQFTPNPAFILIYWGVLFLLQIGFTVLAVAGQKELTRNSIAYGVGIRLALANLFLGGWAIAWVINSTYSFLAGLVLLSLNGLLLLITVLVLAIKYPSSRSRPLDWLFIHAPVKMFLVITIQLDVPQMLFMALGWDCERCKYEDSLILGSRQDEARALWPSFGIITGMGALSAIWIFAASDFTWAACGIYLHFALLYSKYPPLHKRHPEIVAAIILAALLQAVALLGSLVHRAISPAHDNDEGRIALGRNPREEAAAARQEAEAEAAAAAAREQSLSQPAVPSEDQDSASQDPSSLERGEAQQSEQVKVSRTLGSPQAKNKP